MRLSEKMNLGVPNTNKIGVLGAHMKALKLLYGMILLFMKFSCLPDFMASMTNFPRNKSVPDFLPPKVKIIANHQIFLWSAFLSETVSFDLCQTLRLLYQIVKELHDPPFWWICPGLALAMDLGYWNNPGPFVQKIFDSKFFPIAFLDNDPKLGHS